MFLFVTHFGMTQNTHFWDGIETFDGPTDENPILASQLDFYFDRMVAPLPDSITLEIDRLMERASFNTDLRDFILWQLLQKYCHPEYMSQDQVFVYLYDQKGLLCLKCNVRWPGALSGARALGSSGCGHRAFCYLCQARCACFVSL